MKTIIPVACAGLLATVPAFAFETIHSDDVVITANRIEQARENVLADISVIEREEIERAGQSTLVELLQSQPGIEITNNGGAGKASGIFMRGTNSGHVLVLVDGMRINSATLGTTTFENIPVALIDRIEILRGPATSLYGQDAIGGVIQIFTKRGDGAPKFYAGIGAGSYDTFTADAGVHGAVGDTRFALGVSSHDTNGFSALSTSNPNLEDNDGYRNLSFTGSVSQQLFEGHELGAQLLHSKGHTKFDNRFNIEPYFPVYDPAFSDHSDMTQRSFAVTSKNRFLDHWLSSVKIGEGRDRSITYSAPGPFTSETRSMFETRQRQYSWQNDLSLPLGTLTLLYDRLEERVSSTTNFKERSRDNDGYFIGYLLDHGPHSVQVNFRNDHNSQFGNNDSGGIAYGNYLNDNWRITASYGTAFKAPTFNDLYFPDFYGIPTSNPDLQPEESRNFESSLRYTNATSSASLTLYDNRIRDLIMLDENWIPQNISKAHIQGLTLTGIHQLGHWNLHGSLDVQSPRDQDSNNLLVRRSNRHGSATISYQANGWQVSAESIATSARYNDSANKQRLPGYAIFNLTADYAINQDWKLLGRINNIFDKNYVLSYDGNPETNGFAYETSSTNLFVSLRYQPK
jgi:vitamin B12 transporter